MPNLSSIYGASRDYFGHRDYVRARESGISHDEIAAQLDSLNIRQGNTLRDEIQSGTVDESKAQMTPYGGGATTQSPTELANQQMAQQWADMQSAFQESMTNYTTAQQQFQQQQQARQQAFQQQQLAQTQEHQERMLAAQREVRGSGTTRVNRGNAQLSIGPSGPQAPQSASSLARKPTGGRNPVVSGLNISGSQFQNTSSLGIR